MTSPLNKPLTRSRINTAFLGRYRQEGVGPTGLYTLTDTNWYYVRQAVKEEMTDSRHPNLHDLLKRKKEVEIDVGGPFLVRRTRKTNHACGAQSGFASLNFGDKNTIRNRYSGAVIPGVWGHVTSNTSPNVQAVLNALTLPVNPLGDMNAKGTQGWAKMSPTRPTAGLSQFLGELRDLPRLPLMLRDRAKTFLGHSGSEYLNIKFGWEPFVADLKQLIKATQKWDKRLQFLLRNSGKPVRRSGVIEKIISSPSVTNYAKSYYAWPLLTTQNYLNGLKDEKTYTSQTYYEYRFSGKFKFFMKPIGSVGYEEQLLRILFGVELTPRLVWELTPWSWLVDWFTNAGDVISNTLEIAEDSLVAQYAYATGFYRREDVTTVTTNRGFAYGPLSGAAKDGAAYSCRTVEEYQVTQRAEATPYGFGITLSGLSTTQKFILAALGMSRFL